MKERIIQNWNLPQTLPWDQGLGSGKVYCWREGVLVDPSGLYPGLRWQVWLHLKWQVPERCPRRRPRGCSRCRRVWGRVAGRRRPRPLLPRPPLLPETPPTVVEDQGSSVIKNHLMCSRLVANKTLPASPFSSFYFTIYIRYTIYSI